MLFHKLIQERFVRFSLAGGLVFLMGLVILSFQIEVLHVNKILAGFVTTIITVETNFMLNRNFNWGDRRGKLMDQWWRFHAARLGTVTFNQILYIALVTLGVHYLVVTTIGIAIVTLINYFGNDKFVFREGD